jgi:hypothetical protein
MSILNHQWSSISKLLARGKTIINPYRKAYGYSVPVGEQYWTMCGKLVNHDDTENKVSELNQMVRMGLITPDQFHGVEKSEEIHLKNVKAHPDVKLYNNDFLDEMVEASANNTFNPAIVNADLVHLPERAAEYLVKILAFLADLDKSNIMVTCNLIMDNPRASVKSRKNDVDEFLKKLRKEPRWARIEPLWQYPECCYNYGGNGSRSNSNMASYLFYKKL